MKDFRPKSISWAIDVPLAYGAPYSQIKIKKNAKNFFGEKL